MTFAQDLENAARAAVCGWLANGGNAVAATWIVNGVKTPWTAVASAGAALGLFAVNSACNYDPNSGGASPDQAYPAGCRKVSGNFLELGYGCANGLWGVGLFQEFVSLVDTKRAGPGGTTYWRATVKKADGTSVSVETAHSKEEIARTVLLNCQNKPCLDPGGGGGWSPTPLAPHTYTNPTTNCTFVVTHQAWVMSEGGTVSPVLKIAPGAQLLAGGGIIGGCNFPPVVYVPGGPIIPWIDRPDGPDGKPWWYDYLDDIIGAAFGAGIRKLLDELFKETVAGRVYRLTSVCETNANGEPISQSREVVIPDLSLQKAAIYRLDALEYLLQGLKDFKQPVCRTPYVPVTGEWVTVNFESDSISAFGDGPLRKRFRYLDQTSSPLGAHAAHWESFSWEAGPVCVIHKGGAWGVPQVWAATAAEGKRVIRHAGTIAGVDPDSVGEWIVTGSSSDRYGQAGTMRVAIRKARDGSRWLRISKRDSPNGLPLLPSA